MSGIPVVVVERFGLPVKAVEGRAPVMTVSPYGMGIPIVLSEWGAPFIVEGLVPPLNPPGPINDLSVLSTTTSTIALAFTDAARATSHEYQLNGGGWVPLDPSKVIDSLPPDTSFDVQVRGVNDDGDGPPSNTVQAQTQPIPIPVPVNTAVPAITGIAQVGEELTATPGTWSNSPIGYAYQWQRNAGSWADIPGATANTYSLVEDDEGATIRVQVIASNAGGPSVPANSAATGTVQPEPAPTWQSFALTSGSNAFGWGYAIDPIVSAPFGAIDRQPYTGSTLLGFWEAPDDSRTIVAFAGDVVDELDGHTFEIDGVPLAVLTPASYNSGPDMTIMYLESHWMVDDQEYVIERVPAAPVADYTISSDSDWDDIPAPLLADGGVIDIAPGLYASRELRDLRPSAPLIFRAQDPQDMPRLMRFTGFDLWNCEFHDIERVSDAWGAGAAPAWAWSATAGKGNGNIRFVGGAVRGNWRGDVNFPFDPTEEYAEYANIVPQFAAGGAVESLVIRNAVVGTYTPDGQANGTYVNALNFTNGASGNGITFSEQPTTTFVVEDGVIVSATVQSGGASTGTPAMNTNWGILSKVITWDGQIRLFEVMPQGERVVTPSGGDARDVFTGPMEWRDVTWSLLVGGSRGSIAGSGSIHFVGNHFELIYGDSIAYGASANASTAPGVTIEFNTFTRPFSSPRDPGDPHSDPIQLWFAVNDNAFDWPVLVRGNVVWTGEARGTVQGVFIADPPIAGDFGYTGYIYGNLILNADLPNGMSLEQGRDMYIADNTVVRFSPGDPVNGTNTVVTGLGRSGSKVLGHSFFGGNISEAFTTGTIVVDGGTVESAGFSNVSLGRAGVSIPYTDVFDNPGAVRNTLEQVLTAYAPKTGYAEKGAVGRYVDFADRTIDLSQQVVFVGLPDLVAQQPNTSVNSGWRKIIGGPETGAISITGGTYQFADDVSGANATPPTAAIGTYQRDKFIRLAQTTSANEATTTTASVSLNGFSHSFNATTASEKEYPVVAFDGASRFKREGSLGSNGRYLTIAFKMRFPEERPDANLTIFTGVAPTTEAAGVGVVQALILPTGALRVAILNAAGASICQLNASGGDWCDGEVHEVLVSIDVEQPIAGDGRALWIDGANQTSATGAWGGGEGVEIGYSRTTGISGYAIGGGSTNMLPEGVEMEFVYVNIAERADISDGSIRARFDASAIGADGSGVTGNQPHTFVTGVASQWNAVGGVNWGSNGKYVASSGSAVTDVSGDPWP